jgi:hypothetical protein
MPLDGIAEIKRALVLTLCASVMVEQHSINKAENRNNLE